MEFRRKDRKYNYPLGEPKQDTEKMAELAQGYECASCHMWYSGECYGFKNGDRPICKSCYLLLENQEQEKSYAEAEAAKQDAIEGSLFD